MITWLIKHNVGCLSRVQREISVREVCNIGRTNVRDHFIAKSEVEDKVVIVGGGIIGCSTAYWLKMRAPRLRVTVIERDYSYTQASTALSVGGVRMQFSEPENIEMSLFCGHVLNNLGKYFSTSDKKDQNLDVHFVKRGYLLLSSKEKGDILKRNYETQKRLGANVELLSKNDIRTDWPWMNVDDIEYAVHGIDNEGWFDPWSLLCYIKYKCKDLGVIFINGTVTSLKGYKGKLTEAQIKTKDKMMHIGYHTLVNAAGCWAKDIMEMAEKAVSLSGSEYPLFVQKCKRYVFTFSCLAFSKSITTPMVIDESGVYFRRESSGDFICGLSPTEIDEPNTDNLDVDYEWFNDKIWPCLCYRVPVMEALKVKSAWAGYYDYNIKDQNLIIGRHPIITNLILCNGSSGHGIQHAMAIGRANMETILYNEFKSIDLSRLSYNRFVQNKFIIEKNII